MINIVNNVIKIVEIYEYEAMNNFYRTNEILQLYNLFNVLRIYVFLRELVAFFSSRNTSSSTAVDSNYIILHTKSKSSGLRIPLHINILYMHNECRRCIFQYCACYTSGKN